MSTGKNRNSKPTLPEPQVTTFDSGGGLLPLVVGAIPLLIVAVAILSTLIFK